MNNGNIWMVRAGRGGQYVDDFIESNVVAIGWTGAGDIRTGASKRAIEEQLKSTHQDASQGSISMWASQLKRYYDEIQIGDAVTTYDPDQRIYFLGEILSQVEHRDHVLSRARRVKWERKSPRSALQTATRNTLGAISTLFLIKDDAAHDMWSNAVPIQSNVTPEDTAADDGADGDEDRAIMMEVVAKAEEFIEDRIARLDWDEMQELVAEILNAMGYRAQVSQKGADRGHDIFASPDGLGLQEPRIFVEVKHRIGTQIGATEIRSFLGGRQPGDRCLYVSTGGFSKEARYEAERSSIPLMLITLPQLRKLLIEHYESLRPSGTSLVPLERLYWPAN